MLGSSKIFIISEPAQTHEGSLPLAKLLVRASAASGADAVKFQVFTCDELVVPYHSYYDVFKKHEWRAEEWGELVALCHELGMQCYADVFGDKSIRMLTDLHIDGFKIHSTDMRNTALLKTLSRIDRPVLLSIGGATIEEARSAITLLNAPGRRSPIVLMHGFQSYPTKIEDTNLSKMKFFGDTLGLPTGYADHVGGDHRLNFGLCAMAIGMGAVVIEKHITLGRAMKMLDHDSALSPDGLLDFVEKTRELEQAFGDFSDRLVPSEITYRDINRKHVVARKMLEAGHLLQEDDVTLLRAPSERRQSDLEEVIGRKTRKVYGPFEIIYSEDLQ